MFKQYAGNKLGRNSRPRGRNFALKWAKGEVGVSLKKKLFFFRIFIQSPHTHTSCGNNLLPLLTSYFSFNLMVLVSLTAYLFLNRPKMSHLCTLTSPYLTVTSP